MKCPRLEKRETWGTPSDFGVRIKTRPRYTRGEVGHPPELDLQTRVIAPAARIAPERQGGLEIVGAEINDIVTRLILFDTYILDSARFKEIPYLVAAFGVGGLLDLITSKALQLRCEPLAVAQVGQSQNPIGRQGPAMPMCSYAFRVVRIGAFEDFVHRSIQPFHDIPGLAHKDILRLKKTIASNLVRLPSGIENLVNEEMHQELRTNPALLKVAFQMEAKKRFGAQVTEIPITFELCEISPSEFRVETDLSAKLGVPQSDVHSIGQAVGFGVCTLIQRFAEMRAHTALSGFSESDTELAQAKFGALVRAVSSHDQERRFKRVVHISGFPDFKLEWGERTVNVHRLLKLRESEECRAFRDWLRSTDRLSDEQLKEQLSHWRGKLGVIANTIPGKTLRFLASTAIGAVSPLSGLLAGVVDTFIVDKLIPTKGIVSFINNQYPGLFDLPPQQSRL